MLSVTEQIEKHFDIYLDELKKLLQIRSVEEEPSEDAPFGEGPKKALEQILNTASEWGFHTKNLSNAIGFAEWKNNLNSNKYIGILGHVDVVEEGTGWDYPPFDLTIDQDKSFGRGTLDNKGPTLASLFALRLLRDAGKQTDKNIRVIFGTNEESGSNDLKYYLNQFSPPEYGFTPDSQFPAVYGEKGVISLRCSMIVDKETGIDRIDGPFTPSSVPDLASISFSESKVCEYHEGLRSPSNEPQLGINAITLLADKIKSDKRLSEEAQNFFQFISRVFHQKTAGEGFIPDKSLKSWDTQVTPYSLSYEDETFSLEVTIRYSIDKEKEALLNYFNNALPEQVNCQVTRYFPPKKFDRNHFMVRMMKEVYEEATGLNGEPIVTTGATYARFMPNIIAFGPSFPGQIGIAHNKNEYMFVEDLKKNIEIYYKLLERLV